MRKGLFMNMKLELEILRNITKGTAYLEEKDGKLAFHRFTKEQEEFYSTVSADFYNKCFSTAGVMLDFITDGDKIGFKGFAKPCTDPSAG